MRHCILRRSTCIMQNLGCIYILKQIIMATIKPKKTKIEDTVVGTYQKIEDKFVEKFLEGDETDK